MKWYGLNISKFCGIVLSSVTPDIPDTPTVSEMNFIAHIPAFKKLFTVISNDINKEQFNINIDKNKKAFRVSCKSVDSVNYRAQFKINNRKFMVIQS